jgi:hypothetical protein
MSYVMAADALLMAIEELEILKEENNKIEDGLDYIIHDIRKSLKLVALIHQITEGKL